MLQTITTEALHGKPRKNSAAVQISHSWLLAPLWQYHTCGHYLLKLLALAMAPAVPHVRQQLGTL